MSFSLFQIKQSKRFIAAEMTSLAKQLQRLAVPHTQAVLGDDRWKASLLFDPKEAASIDTETYHALGMYHLAAGKRLFILL